MVGSENPYHSGEAVLASRFQRAFLLSSLQSQDSGKTDRLHTFHGLDSGRDFRECAPSPPPVSMPRSGRGPGGVSHRPCTRQASEPELSSYSSRLRNQLPSLSSGRWCLVHRPEWPSAPGGPLHGDHFHPDLGCPGIGACRWSCGSKGNICSNSYRVHNKIGIGYLCMSRICARGHSTYGMGRSRRPGWLCNIR